MVLPTVTSFPFYSRCYRFFLHSLFNNSFSYHLCPLELHLSATHIFSVTNAACAEIPKAGRILCNMYKYWSPDITKVKYAPEQALLKMKCKHCQLYLLPESPSAAETFIASLKPTARQYTTPVSSVKQAQRVGGTLVLPFSLKMDEMFAMKNATHYVSSKHEALQIRAYVAHTFGPQPNAEALSALLGGVNGEAKHAGFAASLMSPAARSIFRIKPVVTLNGTNGTVTLNCYLRTTYGSSAPIDVSGPGMGLSNWGDERGNRNYALLIDVLRIIGVPLAVTLMLLFMAHFRFFC